MFADTVLISKSDGSFILLTVALVPRKEVGNSLCLQIIARRFFNRRLFRMVLLSLNIFGFKSWITGFNILISMLDR